MQAERLSKIDIVKIQMVKDGTIEYRTKQIRNPQDLAELGMKFLKNADREMFVLVCLDNKNCINCIHLVGIGTLSVALVTGREVLKTAILSNSARMAFIHNHPSGNVEPSPEDIQLTKLLGECGDLFDIKVLDHVIISDEGNYGSFLEKGLIKNSPDSMGLRIRDIGTEGEDGCKFGREYCRTTEYRINRLKEGKGPNKLVRFKEFTQAMRKIALLGLQKYSAEIQKKKAVNIPDSPGDERDIYFALEDLIKKIIRSRNLRRESDPMKLALWAYLLWLRLYPTRKAQEA